MIQYEYNIGMYKISASLHTCVITLIVRYIHPVTDINIYYAVKYKIIILRV